ncbi:MAG TPA: glutamine-hydrolyzing GMP synthase, partial [Leptospiraceae bacterium]|nr:glutamine-hydrolyzing GMP synthase [Leptospiraceae bacterium]
HLIASRIRRLGALAQIADPETLTPSEARAQYSGLIYSGGPSSVYEPGAPASDPALLSAGLPVLGICYGHQLMMQQLGGEVRNSGHHEFGRAILKVKSDVSVLRGENNSVSAVWMSHGDEVTRMAPGFVGIAHTDDCENAAVFNAEKNLTGIQFHPEVQHTEHGDQYLLNFIRMCGLENSYRIGDFLSKEKEALARSIGDRSVFFLLSGGVDSTVAFTLLSEILPADRLYGLFIDTGFMRKDEGIEVGTALRAHGIQLNIEDARKRYATSLAGVVDPEKKRRIIGDLFLEIQADCVRRLNLDPEHWLLGQGTIYPDTIESGGTKKSHLIKTHHNRVPAIQRLIEEGKVVEPIRDLYKDEVRELGRLLRLPEKLVDRHPFPGPGLAIRLLCSDADNADFRSAAALLAEHNQPLLKDIECTILPIKSVGVQGDQRTYAHPALVYEREGDTARLHEIARALPNFVREVNRVLRFVAGNRPEMVRKAELSADRVERLREADHVVNSFLHEKNIYGEIWQFPVVLVPLARKGVEEDAVILRPVVSLDAMTVSPYEIKRDQLKDLSNRLLAISGIGSILYDLTTKPPGTIEWE